MTTAEIGLTTRAHHDTTSGLPGMITTKVVKGSVAEVMTGMSPHGAGETGVGAGVLAIARRRSKLIQSSSSLQPLTFVKDVNATNLRNARRGRQRKGESKKRRKLDKSPN